MLYQEMNGIMTEDQITAERFRYNLIDLDHNGYITWNEFLEFETGEILSKKNKVSLLDLKLISYKKICFIDFIALNLRLNFPTR